MDKTILSGTYYAYFDKEKDRDIINNIMKIYTEKRYVNFDVPGLLKENIYHNMDSIVTDTYNDVLPYYKDIENKDNQLLQFLCECNSNTMCDNNFTFGFAKDDDGNVVGIVLYEFNSSIKKIPLYVADNEEKEVSLYYKILVENIAYFIFKDICGSDDIVMFSDYSITEDNKESLIVYEDFPFAIHIDFENFPGREVTFYNIDIDQLYYISNHYNEYDKIRVVPESKLKGHYCNFVEEFKFIDFSVIDDLVL